MDATTIGYYELNQSRVFQNTFECAAWYEDVNIEPGKYSIEVYDMHICDRDNKVNGYIGGGWIKMNGTIVSDYFAGQFCGVPISDYDTTQNAGKSSSHTAMVYLYEIAYSILKDKDSPYHLNPEYEARKISFISIIDGKPCTAYGIFKK